MTGKAKIRDGDPWLSSKKKAHCYAVQATACDPGHARAFREYFAKPGQERGAVCEMPDGTHEIIILPPGLSHKFSKVDTGGGATGGGTSTFLICVSLK